MALPHRATTLVWHGCLPVTMRHLAIGTLSVCYPSDNIPDKVGGISRVQEVIACGAPSNCQMIMIQGAWKQDPCSHDTRVISCMYDLLSMRHT